MMTTKSLGALLLIASFPCLAQEAMPNSGRAFDGVIHSDQVRRLPELDTTLLRAKLIELKNSKQNEASISNINGALSGPAPAISNLQVYAVISTQHPTWEYLTSNQTATANDHGGAEMYVVTYELGYGNNPVCKINGISLTQYNLQAITDASGIAIGFFHYYTASGFQGGTWTYQNQSSNAPWNTMFDSATIQ